MKRCCLVLVLIVLTGLTAGCTGDNLRAPCPNFGANCAQSPVNGWGGNE